MCACGLCALNFVIRISICRSNMRNHADMRSCVTEGNRNTRNRIQEITNFHSSYNSVDQRSSRFRNPSEFTSLILKAHRSFSSGVPEPVMSVANMNSCIMLWGSIPFLFILMFDLAPWSQCCHSGLCQRSGKSGRQTPARQFIQLE